MESKRWIEDWLSARAEADKTKTHYVTCLKHFVEFCSVKWNKDFYKVVEEWRKARLQGPKEIDPFIDQWTDIVRNYNTCIKPRYAPLTVKNLLAVIKSFFRFWKIPVDVDLPRRACVIYHNRDLAREDVRQILTYASPRDRVMWLIMAESGMRAQTAVKLKYWQIKEDFEKDLIPMRIVTPAAALKDHVGDRWTFIGEDGVRELKEYLKPRVPLKDDDYVFASEKPGKVAGDQFSVASLSVKFGRVAKKLGLHKSRGSKPSGVRMHGLRKYFRNKMKAEAAYREFWMGHSLGVDAHYITRDVDVHRKKYLEGYEFLRIFEPSAGSITELISEMRKKTQEIKALKEQNQEFKEQIQDLKVRLLRTIQELIKFVGAEQVTPEELQKLLKELASEP
ncbi:MAG: hypothetical protein OEY47_06615 [Candidatus Bathyarchaeota archaeon]|nr:hypothetical protein [Candidatus Bathyarchaeota archaeon]